MYIDVDPVVMPRIGPYSVGNYSSEEAVKVEEEEQNSTPRVRKCRARRDGERNSQYPTYNELD